MLFFVVAKILNVFNKNLNLMLEGNIFTLGINDIATCRVPKHQAVGKLVQAGELHTGGFFFFNFFFLMPVPNGSSSAQTAECLAAVLCKHL